MHYIATVAGTKYYFGFQHSKPSIFTSILNVYHTDKPINEGYAIRITSDFAIFPAISYDNRTISPFNYRRNRLFASLNYLTIRIYSKKHLVVVSDKVSVKTSENCVSIMLSRQSNDE